MLLKLWQNHKSAVVGWFVGIILTFGGSYLTYVLTAVKSYEETEQRKELTSLITEIITNPITLAAVLTDSNVVKAQKIREQNILKTALKDAMHNKQPDSLKLSKRLVYTMDLKRSQKVENEIAWMYEFCKVLQKAIEDKKNRQGTPKKIKL